MTQEQRIHAFARLGSYISEGSETLDTLIQTAHHYNGWFTPEQVESTLKQWGALLTKKNLEQWLAPYADRFGEKDPKTVGLILAGNIPLVGFHDVLSVLITGHRAMVKASSQDPKLIPHLLEQLVFFEPAFSEQIILTERLAQFDAVIATGSNNSSRYFDHYFGPYPHIIRKNRNSVAVLTGKETAEELLALGKDIFMYFGLGCRNVSKLYVPEGYTFDQLYEAIEPYKTVLDHYKYSNNYDYNRTLLLMNSVPHVDNRFLMISENASLSSPMASLHYETYTDDAALNETLTVLRDQIQCVVSSKGWLPGSFAFGEAQKPLLEDYADGVNTLDFLATL
jgi:hypothetical protein